MGQAQWASRFETRCQKVSGKPLRKMPERLARLKAFRERCEMSGNLIFCARREARAALCPESNNWDPGAASKVFPVEDLIGQGCILSLCLAGWACNTWAGFDAIHTELGAKPGPGDGYRSSPFRQSQSSWRLRKQSAHKLRSRARSGGTTSTETTAGPQTATVVFSLEPHFTPIQLARLWGLSSDCIRDLFLDEAGALLTSKMIENAV